MTSFSYIKLFNVKVKYDKFGREGKKEVYIRRGTSFVYSTSETPLY